MTPNICVVHNNIDSDSSIGLIAKWNVTTALEQGWHVTVVAHDLDPELRRHVDWKHLWIPRLAHLGQWLAARPTIRAALGGARFDVLHVHQAQVAAIADVWQVHYLSRPARNYGGFAESTSLRGRVVRAEQYGVMLAEDVYLRRLHRKSPMVLFVSALLRDEFARIYQLPASHGVLTPPISDEARVPRDTERERARRDLVGNVPPGTTVLGFLGGLDPRKGYRELLQALAETPDVLLLFAGPGSEGTRDGRLGARLRALGFLQDLRIFFEAIDALVVPSRFEPYGMVVHEAWSHGVPVICSPTVGAAREPQAALGSLTWVPGHPLTGVIAELRKNADSLRAGVATAHAAASSTRANTALVAHWEQTLAAKNEAASR